jgi:hypothetical protein
VSHQARDEGDPKEGGHRCAPFCEEVLHRQPRLLHLVGNNKARRLIGLKMRQELAHNSGDLAIAAAHNSKETRGFGKKEK